MKAVLMILVLVSMSNFALATGNGGVGSVGGAILSCTGLDPASNQQIRVIINAAEQTVSINGEVSAAEFRQGPEANLMAIGNATVFIGLSTKDYKKAMLNTATLEQVELSCDGTHL